ncbi:MAG: peptide chain release factor N(5)-glutamine methyltransferase [Dehalococcoidales bacterium]|nr:peptide chain release factor N(5)-glutamine methyltransferase [Dehalococcoidales bacterium]
MIETSIKIKEALEHGRRTFAASDIEDPKLEAEVLLRHVLNIDRVRLYLDTGRELSAAEYATYRLVLKRRLNGEPSAYITGHREFFGLDFYVDYRVLIPRPETEIMVETALEFASARPVHLIADIGTGSGAVAVSLATRLTRATIYAVDISDEALTVAAENARKHGVSDRIRFLRGDLLAPIPEAVDMIIANLPYVKEAELREVNTWGYEPALALDGGKDGLDVIRRLIGQLKGKLKPGGALLMEIGAGQGSAVTEILADTFPRSELRLISDGAGFDRVVTLTIT